MTLLNNEHCVCACLHVCGDIMDVIFKSDSVQYDISVFCLDC